MKDFATLSLPREKVSYVALFDLAGKEVKRIQSDNPTVIIPKDDLLPGCYIVNISSGRMQTSRKLLIE